MARAPFLRPAPGAASSTRSSSSSQASSTTRTHLWPGRRSSSGRSGSWLIAAPCWLRGSRKEAANSTRMLPCQEDEKAHLAGRLIRQELIRRGHLAHLKNILASSSIRNGRDSGRNPLESSLIWLIHRKLLSFLSILNSTSSRSKLLTRCSACVEPHPVACKAACSPP